MESLNSGTQKKNTQIAVTGIFHDSSNLILFFLLFGIRCFYKPLGLFLPRPHSVCIPLFFLLSFFPANKLRAAAKLRGGKREEMTKDKRERLMCLIKSWLWFGPNRRAAQPEPCGTRRCRNPSELCQGQFDLRASRSAGYRNHHGCVNHGGAVNQSAVQGFRFQAQLRLTCRLWGF